MDKEQQRIVISEICNWKPPYMLTTLCEWTDENGNRMLSDPLEDLNAMYAAESILTGGQCTEFRNHLESIVEEPLDVWHATSAERAKAFIKTFGRWKT